MDWKTQHNKGVNFPQVHLVLIQSWQAPGKDLCGHRQTCDNVYVEKPRS